MKYSGIDLHSNNSVTTVTDEEDHVFTEKRLPNYLTKIVGFLLPWREELKAVVIESTYNWTVRYDWLSHYLFESIGEAQDYATGWMWTYNHERPNMALGGITPKQKLALAN